MNENVRVMLGLFCTVAAWAWTWCVLADRWTARGKNRFTAHVIGALLGAGAPFGAFCLSSAFLIPGAINEARITLGGLGALVLLAYFSVLHPLKKKDRQGAEVLPAVITAPMQAAPTPRKPLKTMIATWWQEEKRRQAESAQHSEKKRLAREKALGMSIGAFFGERMGAHLVFWGFVLFVLVWSRLFFEPLAADTFGRLVISFIVTCLLAIGIVFSFLFIVPFFLLLLILLPFASVSIIVEAWWRIRHDKPCIATPPTVTYYREKKKRKKDTSAPSQNCGNWLVPLAIGLWLGHLWDNDH